MKPWLSTDPSAWAPWWVLAYVALWPAPGYAEGVLSLGALWMLLQLVGRRLGAGGDLLSPEAWALTSMLFVAYWVPELASTLDSANVWRSLGEVATDLRYLPFLWLAAAAMATPLGRRRVGAGIALIVAAWTLDGLVQALTGFSLGGLVTEDRLSGIFGSGNLKLGLVLASLAPFAIDAAAARWRFSGWLLAAVAIGLVILLAGARAAWLSFALVLLWTGSARFGWRRTVLTGAVGGVLALGLTAWLSAPLQERLVRTAALYEQGGFAGFDHALSNRLTIWRSALAMAADHPLNGVGVRGFRDAYPNYIQPGDPPLIDGVAFHAHQIVLEVLSETGAIGILLWLAGAALAWRAWGVASEAARARARLPMLALGVTVFPLNTHLAFYSTFWGGLTLLLAALYAGALLSRDGEADQG